MSSTSIPHAWIATVLVKELNHVLKIDSHSDEDASDCSSLESSYGALTQAPLSPQRYYHDGSNSRFKHIPNLPATNVQIVRFESKRDPVQAIVSDGSTEIVVRFAQTAIDQHSAERFGTITSKTHAVLALRKFEIVIDHLLSDDTRRIQLLVTRFRHLNSLPSIIGQSKNICYHANVLDLCKRLGPEIQPANNDHQPPRDAMQHLLADEEALHKSHQLADDTDAIKMPATPKQEASNPLPDPNSEQSGMQAVLATHLRSDAATSATVFTPRWRETFEDIPVDQRELLQRSSSWYKPVPGESFPQTNVPTSFLAYFRDLIATADRLKHNNNSPDHDSNANSILSDRVPRSRKNETLHSEGTPVEPEDWPSSPPPAKGGIDANLLPIQIPAQSASSKVNLPLVEEIEQPNHSSPPSPAERQLRPGGFYTRSLSPSSSCSSPSELISSAPQSPGEFQVEQNDLLARSNNALPEWQSRRASLPPDSSLPSPDVEVPALKVSQHDKRPDSSNLTSDTVIERNLKNATAAVVRRSPEVVFEANGIPDVLSGQSEKQSKCALSGNASKDTEEKLLHQIPLVKAPMGRCASPSPPANKVLVCSTLNIPDVSSIPTRDEVALHTGRSGMKGLPIPDEYQVRPEALDAIEVVSQTGLKRRAIEDSVCSTGCQQIKRLKAVSNAPVNYLSSIVEEQKRDRLAFFASKSSTTDEANIEIDESLSVIQKETHHKEQEVTPTASSSTDKKSKQGTARNDKLDASMTAAMLLSTEVGTDSPGHAAEAARQFHSPKNSKLDGDESRAVWFKHQRRSQVQAASQPYHSPMAGSPSTQRLAQSPASSITNRRSLPWVVNKSIIVSSSAPEPRANGKQVAAHMRSFELESSTAAGQRANISAISSIQVLESMEGTKIAHPGHSNSDDYEGVAEPHLVSEPVNEMAQQEEQASHEQSWHKADDTRFQQFARNMAQLRCYRKDNGSSVLGGITQMMNMESIKPQRLSMDVLSWQF